MRYQKPDVMAFRHIESKLGFTPEDSWYIGDTYEADILSAGNAGWHSVWFNHRKRICQTDIEIQSKEDIFQLVNEMIRNTTERN